jgi:diadenosine tetraphosphate (Ap4A) HIT family hydrolase
MSFDPSHSVAECPFCGIAGAYAPAPPTAPVTFDPDLVVPSAFVVLSTPLVMAFLDIMPLSPGHLLVTTRRHHSKVSDVTVEESREIGYWLPVLSRVLAKTTGVWDWNIVQNNGMFCNPHYTCDWQFQAVLSKFGGRRLILS